MKKQLLSSWLWLLPFIASAQTISQPPAITITQAISLPDLQAGKPVSVSLNLAPATYWKTIQNGRSIVVWIQVNTIPPAMKPNLRLGLQGPLPPTPAQAAGSLIFDQDWKPGESLALQFVDTTPGAPKLEKLTITEPPLPDPTATDTDALLIDFCPDGPHIVQYPSRRSWAFAKPGETTRLNAKHINPLKSGVSVDVASIAFNTDVTAAQAGVNGILKGAITASGFIGQPVGTPDDEKITATDNVVDDLLDILSTIDTLNAQLDRMRQESCLSDDLVKQGMLTEGKIRKKLRKYPNEVWLDFDLKRMAEKVGAIATHKKPPLSEVLIDLAAYSKREGVAKEIFSLLKTLSAIPGGTTLRTPPVAVDDHRGVDVLRFTMTTKNRLDSTSPAVSQFYDVWILGRAKIDFSAGLVVNYLADQTMAITDEVVKQTVPVEGVNKEIDVVRQKATLVENKDNATLAFATMAHLYWRTACAKGGLNFGLTLGGGLTTKGRPILLAGGSVLIGRQQRVVLSGGVAVGTQKELSNRYSDTVNYYPSDPADFTYVDRTRVRGFFGLTFNFGQNEKKEIIIGAPAKEKE